MKIRRENDCHLYIQSGDDPSPGDEYLGHIMDPLRAKYLIEIINEHFAADHECSIGR